MKLHLWGSLGGRGAFVHKSHVHGNALSHMNESYCQVVDYLVRNRSLSKLALHAKETRENVSPI